MSELIVLRRGAGSISHIQPLDETSFCAWFAQAEPGDVLEYHRGFLCLDRGTAATDRKTTVQRQLNQLANRAYDLAERGFVHLVQRRKSPAGFGYFAIARPGPRREPVAFTTLMTEEAA